MPLPQSFTFLGLLLVQLLPKTPLIPLVLEGLLCLFLELFCEFRGLLSLIWMSFSGGGNPKIFDS